MFKMNWQGPLMWIMIFACSVQKGKCQDVAIEPHNVVGNRLEYMDDSTKSVAWTAAIKCSFVSFWQAMTNNMFCHFDLLAALTVHDIIN